MFAALLLTAVATTAPAREFRAADTQSEDYPTVQALRFMGRLIEEKTGGRLQIRVFHSRQPLQHCIQTAWAQLRSASGGLGSSCQADCFCQNSRSPENAVNYSLVERVLQKAPRGNPAGCILALAYC